jgi:hypothetical protein
MGAVVSVDPGLPGGVIAVLIVIFLLSSVTLPGSTCYLGNLSSAPAPVLERSAGATND